MGCGISIATPVPRCCECSCGNDARVVVAAGDSPKKTDTADGTTLAAGVSSQSFGVSVAPAPSVRTNHQAGDASCPGCGPTRGGVCAGQCGDSCGAKSPLNTSRPDSHVLPAGGDTAQTSTTLPAVLAPLAAPPDSAPAGASAARLSCGWGKPGSRVIVDSRQLAGNGDGATAGILPVPSKEGSGNDFVRSDDVELALQRAHDDDTVWTVLDCAPAGLVLADHRGRILFANAALEAMFGHRRRALRRQPLTTLFAPSCQDELDALRSACTGDEQANEPRPDGVPGPSPKTDVGRELNGVRADGSQIVVHVAMSTLRKNSDGSPSTPTGRDSEAALALVITDLTARRKEDQRFRLAVEAAPNGMVLVDGNGKIVMLNTFAERMFGYDAGELINQPIEVLVPGRFREAHPDLRKMFMLNPSVRSMGAGRELFARRKSGEQFPVEIGLNPVDSLDGMLVLANIVDISERKSLERLQRERDAAETESRSRAALLAAMSHEIRTPLTGVVGCLELLAGEYLNPQQEDLVHTARRCTDMLLSTINDILYFSKLESGREEALLSRVSLRSVLHDVETVANMALRGKQVEWRTSVDDCVPAVVIADGGRLRQVLLNLVSNAAKFTRRGSITLRVSCSQPLPMQRIASSSSSSMSTPLARPRFRPGSSGTEGPSAGGAAAHAPRSLNAWASRASSVDTVASDAASMRLLISVEDTGIGIPHAIQTKLFRPFVQAGRTTAQEFGGTGLGLAICKRLVELMGGSISVTSEPGAGSTFTFDVLVGVPADSQAAALPLAPLSSLPQPDLTIAMEEDGPRAGGNGAALVQLPRPVMVAPVVAALNAHARDLSAPILLADDDATGSRIVSTLLRRVGAKSVTVVRDGGEAVRAASEKPYALIFMDCEMPVMSGFDATTELRRREVMTPIIAMTANAMVGDRERCLEAGMDDYLSKPVTLQELVVFLEKWLPPADEQAPPEPNDAAAPAAAATADP